MKQAVLYAYSFTAATRQVDTAIPGFQIEKLYAIINQTKNQIIYAASCPEFGLNSYSGSVVTLLFDTTTMSNSDELMIVYDQAVDVSGSIIGLDSTSLAALENITVTVSNEVEIKNDAGNPVPISAASLPLPPL
jgi:hypothetical protein